MTTKVSSSQLKHFVGVVILLIAAKMIFDLLKFIGPGAAFVEANLEGALTEEPRPGVERKLSSKEEALLVATACSKPPPGRARWTLELLADEMVRLTDHEGLSSETVVDGWRRTTTPRSSGW